MKLVLFAMVFLSGTSVFADKRYNGHSKGSKICYVGAFGSEICKTKKQREMREFNRARAAESCKHLNEADCSALNWGRLADWPYVVR